MTYQDLIETISLMVENPKIHKNGLTLLYELNEQDESDFEDLAAETAGSINVNIQRN